MNTVIEKVEYQVTSPKRALPGLEYSLKQLDALSASIKRVQAQLAGLSSNAAYKLSARQFTERAFNAKGVAQLSVKQLARKLGFPDGKDVQAVANQFENDIQSAIGKINRKIENSPALGKRALENYRKQIRELQGQSLFSDPSARTFKNPTTAGRFFERYSGLALKEKQRGEQALMAILSGAVPSGSGAAAAAASPANLAQAVKQATRPAAGTATTGGKQAASRRPPAAQTTTRIVTDEAGGLIEEKITTYPGTDKPDKITRTRRAGAGRTIATTVQGESVSETVTDKVAKRRQKQFEAGLTKIEREFRANLPAASGTSEGIRDLRANAIRQARALYRSNPQFAQLGFRDQLGEFAGQTLPNASQAEMRRLAAQRATLVKARAKAEADDDRLRAEQIRQELATLEANRRRLGKFNQSRSYAQMNAARQAEKVAAFEQKQQQAAAYRSATYAGAEFALQDFLGSGGKVVSQRSAYKGAPSQIVATKESGGQLHTLTVEFGKAGASANLATKAMRETRQEVGMLGGDFVKNTIKVAAWSASVGVLYQGLGLLEHSFSQMIAIGSQTARLDQVFRKVGGSTQELVADILHLAAANGRSTEEAMNSALQWSRLGLNRMQVNEAVKISLMAANDANVDAAETTENLQAIMQTYGLRVGQLRTLLGELVYITNSYNVTTGDMLTGLSRTAAAAKQAGLPLAELQGILAATIGATGQSGANIGNAIKSVTLALSNPALQEKLRTMFRFEVSTGGEDIKNMSQLLGDLYVRYEKLNDAQRQSLLFSVAGRTQANRLAAMMDNYVRAQTLAINAQLNLNNAEEENAKITNTLKAQLSGVAAEWERLVLIQSNRGPVAVLSQIAVALKNVMTIMNAPGMNMVTTGMLGLGAVAVGRAAMATLSVKNGAQQGFIGRSGAAIVREAQAVNNAVNSAMMSTVMSRNPQAMQTRALYQNGKIQRTAGGGIATGQFLNINQLGMMDKFILKTNIWGQAMMRAGTVIGQTSRSAGLFYNGLGLGLKAVSAATLALSEFLIPLAAIYAGITAFNWGMDKLGMTIDATQQKLAGFNREAEKSRSAADAYAEAAQAMSTFQKAFNPSHGMMRPEDMSRLVNRMPDLMHLTEPDEAKRDKMQAAAKAQLTTMLRANDLAGIRNMLEQQQSEYAAARVQQLDNEYETTRKTVREIERKIIDLKSIHASIGQESRSKNIQELEQQKSEAMGKGVRILMDESETMDQSWELRLQYDEKHLANLEKEKLTVQTIAEIYNQIPSSNPLERAQANIASLQAQQAVIAQRKTQINDEDAHDTAGHQAMEEKKKEIAKKLNKARDEYNFMMGSVPGGYRQGNTLYDFSQVSPADLADRRKKFGEIQALQNQYDSVNPEAAGPGAIGMVGRQKEFGVLTEQERANAAQLEAQKKNLELVEKQRQYGLGQTKADQDSGAYKYGRNETEKILNERRHLMAEIGTLMQKQNKDMMDYGRLMEDVKLAEEATLALRQRRMDVEREIHQLAIDQNKEFAKSFFGSGPAEMLRKLAAFRMASRGGVSQGQLYSMSPGLREDVGHLTGQNPEMAWLKQEKAQLDGIIHKLAGFSDDRPGTDLWGNRFDQLMKKFSDKFTAAIQGLGPALVNGMAPDTAVLEAANRSMAALGSAANQAAAALMRIAATVAGAPAGAGLTLTPPPQSGGWSPGTSTNGPTATVLGRVQY